MLNGIMTLESLQNFLTQNNLTTAAVTEYDTSDNLWVKATVMVDRSEYEKAIQLTMPESWNVKFEQRKPQFVSANIGDFVLIWNKFSRNDDDCAVGIVSAKYGNMFGCRYILTNLGNQFCSQNHLYTLTGDNYGGHHEGFYRVLTAEEALAHLHKQAERAYEEAVQHTKWTYEEMTKQLPKLVSNLQGAKKITITKLKFKEDCSLSLDCKN